MPESNISRRHFLQMAGAVTLGFSALRYLPETAFAATSGGYGPLIPDPKGIFDLPKGFKYRVISEAGQTMNDGLIVPGRQDGMAAFPGKNGKTILIRNHETAPDLAIGDSLGPFGKHNELLHKVDKSRLYDAGLGKTPHAGGTTTLVYDTKTGKLESQFLSLSGTNRNCAGGPTPWNTWISCEEALPQREIAWL
jgi:secreted PhoX family phosphatase